MKKTKNNSQTLCYLFSLLFLTLSYMLLNNVIISILNSAIFFYVIYKDIFLTYHTVIVRIKTHEEFRQFANSLIMQLSVTPNINETFNHVATLNSDEYKDILLDNSLTVEEKLDNLEIYFPIPLFYILKRILLVYIEQGGKILDMSQELLNKSDQEISNMQEVFSLNKHKWTETIIMWIFAILGFVYLKCALISYYQTLIKEFAFIICIELFLLSFIITLKLSSNKYLKEQIEL